MGDKVPRYNERLYDDEIVCYRRNYVMNKQQGLVIRPFKKAHLTRHLDKELLYLMQYLTLIGQLPKLSHLDHRKWERYLQKHAAAAVESSRQQA